MARARAAQNRFPGGIPLSVLILWIFGGTSFALIVYLFTPYTHNLDDIKVTFQYVFGPIVWGFFAVALWCGYLRRVHPAVVLSLFAFLLVMVASTIFARFPWRAWRDLGYQLTIMAPFIVIVGTCTNEQRFRNICLFYFLIAAGTVVFGLFHYFGGVGMLLRLTFPQGPPRDHMSPLYTLRSNGDMLSTILNRDFYPAYLLMVVPLGMAMIFYYRDRRARLFFVAMFLLMILCIVLARSKDTYLALFLMGLFFVVMAWAPHDRVAKTFLFLIFILIAAFIALAFVTYRARLLMLTYLVVIFAWFVFVMYRSRVHWQARLKKLTLLWVIAGAVLLATVLVLNWRLWNPQEVQRHLGELKWENFISIESRKVIWGGGVQIFFDPDLPFPEFIKCIFLGAGGGSFYLSFPAYRSPNYHLYEISNVTLFAHNHYCDLLCEQGLLGLGTFLVFLFIIARHILREAWRKTDHPLNLYQVALATAIVGISFQNFFSPAIRWTVCGFNYWFLLGLVVAGAHMTFSPQEVRRIERFYDYPRSLRRAIAVAFLVFALVFEVMSIQFGLRRFCAAKNNNDGLIRLSSFSELCSDLQNDLNDKQLRATTERWGYLSVDRFRTALAWMPSFITSHYKLAHVYSRMAWPVETNPDRKVQWWKRAERTYRELAKFAPDYSEIHLNYGILGGAFYEATGDPRRLMTSLIEFHRAAEMSNKFNVQMYYSRRLQLAARVAPVAGSRGSSETLRMLADCLEEITPAEVIDDAVDRRSTQIRRLLESGEYQEAAMLIGDQFNLLAIRVCEHIIEQAEWFSEGLPVPVPVSVEMDGEEILAEARAIVADYYLPRRQYDKALTALEALVREEHDPSPMTRSTHLSNYVAACLEAGEYPRCLKLLEHRIKENPVDWRPRESARVVFMKIGAYARALEQAQAVLEIVERKYAENPRLADPKEGPTLRAREGGMPPLPEAMFRVGQAAQKIDDLEHLEEAHNMYQQVIEQDPEGPWGKKALESILEIERRIEQAPPPEAAPTSPSATISPQR